jgi:hypothetical protein
VETGFPKRSCSIKTPERQSILSKTTSLWAHDPEKWKPVFRKDHAQSKCQSDSRFYLKQLRSGRMIRKSGNRFSAKIMLNQNARATVDSI